MQPEEVRFFVYANNEDEASELQVALYDFVRNFYRRGTVVTAKRMENALRLLSSSPFVEMYFND